jgi:hypothetical protein
VKIGTVSGVLFFNVFQVKEDPSLSVCGETLRDQTDIDIPVIHGDNRSDVGRETSTLSLLHKGGQYESFCETGDVAAVGKRKEIRFRTNY